MKKIVSLAIYKTSSLGDAILSTACLDFIENLKSRSPETEIKVTWFGRSPFRKVFLASYPSLDFIDLEQPYGTLGPFDLVIDLQANIRSKRFCKDLTEKNPSSKLVQWESRSFARTLLVVFSHLGPRRESRPSQIGRIPQKYLDFTSTLEKGLLDFFPIEDLETVKAISRPRLRVGTHSPQLKRVILGIAPGAAFDTKRAPPPMFVSIIRELLQIRQKNGNSPFVILFIGQGRELDICRQIAERLPTDLEIILPPLKDTDVLESAEAINSCRAVLGNDSAPVHLAEALGLPVATLFGPTSEQFGFSPVGDLSKAFSTNLSCRPCSKHGKAPCRYGDKLCFTKIPVNEVASYLDLLLNRELA